MWRRPLAERWKYESFQKFVSKSVNIYSSWRKWRPETTYSMWNISGSRPKTAARNQSLWVDLTNNPLQCDISMCWVFHLKSSVEVHLSDYPCSMPSQLRKKTKSEIVQHLDCGRCIQNDPYSIYQISDHPFCLGKDPRGAVHRSWNRMQSSMASISKRSTDKINKQTS